MVDYAELVGSPVPSSYGIKFVYDDPSGYILDEAIEQLKSQQPMRKCSGYYTTLGKSGWVKHEFTNGLFHQFGNNYTEFESGAGNYTTGIVELDDSRVVEAVVGSIKFER